MSETVNPKQSLKALGLEGYRTKTGAFNAGETVEPAEAKLPSAADPVETVAATERDTTSDRKEGEMGAIVSLGKYQGQKGRNRLDEIAALVLALTYGEMIELADAIWQAQAEGLAITQENLPALLHRWSKGRANEVPAISGPDAAT